MEQINCLVKFTSNNSKLLHLLSMYIIIFILGKNLHNFYTEFFDKNVNVIKTLLLSGLAKFTTKVTNISSSFNNALVTNFEFVETGNAC